MRPAILFPPAETAIVGWLPGALAPHGDFGPVSTRIPNPRPAKFVRILRTGGPAVNLVTDGAQVTVEVWNNDAFQAEQDAATVRAILNAVRNTRTSSGVLLHRVDEFGGPAALPDVSGQPRYSWTVQVHLRGTSL